MIDLAFAILAAYIATAVVTVSHLFERPRDLFAAVRVRVFGYESYPFEECRMCVGAYVSAAVWGAHYAVNGPWSFWMWLPVWGGSYFLATQERPLQ